MKPKTVEHQAIAFNYPRVNCVEPLRTGGRTLGWLKWS